MYVTDTLWGLAHGRCTDKRFIDLLQPAPPEETRTPEEIIERVGAVFRGGGG